MKQDKFENYMELATVVAKRSHDSQTQVGAVLVRNDTGAPVATGFNGFVRGAPDDVLPTTRPDKYEYIMHSEENIIAHCARHGISTDNTTLYVTLTPCKRCTRLLFQCGISAVVAKDKYRDFNDTLQLTDIEVSCADSEQGWTKLAYSRRNK